MNIDVGNPDIIVTSTGMLLKDLRVKNGKNLNPVYDDPRITAIGDSAFKNSMLESIEAPYVKDVGSHAFDECHELKRVSLASVGHIGDRAFAECRKLSDLRLSSDLWNLGDYAFAYTDLASLDLSSASKLAAIPTGCFCGMFSLKEVKMPKHLTSIGADAFFACSSLSKIEWPVDRTLMRIGVAAFQGCAIEELSLPEGFGLKIEDRAFEQCEKLRKVSLPKSTKFVGEEAFSRIADDAIITCDSPHVGDWDEDSKEWNGGHLVTSQEKPLPLREMADKGKEIVSAAFFALRSMFNEYNGLPGNSDDIVRIKQVQPRFYRGVDGKGKIRYVLSMELTMDDVKEDDNPLGADDLSKNDLTKYGKSVMDCGRAIKDALSPDMASKVLQLLFREKLLDSGDVRPSMSIFVNIGEGD